MSSNRPSGRPSSGNGVPPTTRRSARQQRPSGREANRSLAGATTRGGGGGMNSLVLYSGVAVVIAIVVIGAALLLTGGSKANPLNPDASPAAPQGSGITLATVASNGRTLGDANAKHTIDIWEDFQCPNCRDFSIDIESQLVSKYVATGQAKLVFHDYLVIDSKTGGHESLDAANAARCAADQGKFWPYHDWLYTNQYGEGTGAFTKDRLKLMGQEMGGLDTAKFNSCVDGGTHDAEVTTESSQPPSGNAGTPAVLVDGTITASSGTPAWDYGTISTALNAALGITPSPSVVASSSASAAPTATPAATPSATPTPVASPSAS